MSRVSNFPSAQSETLNGKEFTGNVIGSLMELSAKGTPATVEELEQRINEYFSYCQEKNLRPGIETMCLALSVNRSTFWRWCNGERRVSDSRWTEICLRARQVVISFLECASLSGKLNPPTAIFLMKNWGGYSDNADIASTANQQVADYLTLKDLPILGEKEEE